jgi:hypothetical protein
VRHTPAHKNVKCNKGQDILQEVISVSDIESSGVFYYHYFVCEAIGTAATPGLWLQPRVIVKIIVEKQMECRLAGEPDVLGEIRPQHHFCPSQTPT